MLRNILHPRKNREIKILEEDSRLSYTWKYIYIYTFVRFKSSRRIISLLSSHPYPPLFFPSSSSFTLHPTLPRQSSLIIVTRRTASPFLHACTIHGTRSHRPMRNAWREKRGSSAVDDRAWTLAGRSFKSVADACMDALGDSILVSF